MRKIIEQLLSMFCLLKKGIMSKHRGNFYCLNCLPSSATENKQESYKKVCGNCLFSYAGTWELVNLFVGTKNFIQYICYENIGQKLQHKHESRDIHRQNMDRQNCKICQYASRVECIKWNMNIHWRFQGLTEDQKESCFKTLDDLQNLLIKRKIPLPLSSFHWAKTFACKILHVKLQFIHWTRQEWQKVDFN